MIGTAARSGVFVQRLMIRFCVRPRGIFMNEVKLNFSSRSVSQNLSGSILGQQKPKVKEVRSLVCSGIKTDCVTGMSAARLKVRDSMVAVDQQLRADISMYIKTKGNCKPTFTRGWEEWRAHTAHEILCLVLQREDLQALKMLPLTDDPEWNVYPSKHVPMGTANVLRGLKCLWLDAMISKHMDSIRHHAEMLDGDMPEDIATTANSLMCELIALTEKRQAVD